MRLAACLGLAMDLIEPCGFVLDDRRLRRSGMDYLRGLDLTRHASWDRFLATRAVENHGAGRLVLLTTQGSMRHLDFRFQANDTLLLGRESAGVPPVIHNHADARIRVPMQPEARSLNVALATALVLGEALRQTQGFPAG